jgi:hypothetical protein
MKEETKIVQLPRRQQKRRNRNEKLSRRSFARAKNFSGEMISSFRLRCTTQAITTQASGLLTTANISCGTAILTTDSASYLARFQRYRITKAVANISAPSLSAGMARFYWQDYNNSATNDTDVPYRLVTYHSASQYSRATMTYVAADYPELEFVPKSTASTLCKLIYEDASTSAVGSVNTYVLLVDVWLYIDAKMFD